MLFIVSSALIFSASSSFFCLSIIGFSLEATLSISILILLTKCQKVYTPSHDLLLKAKTKPLVNKVGVKCPKCKEENVNCITKQTRGGDEGATELYVCLSCGYQWKYNN